MPTSDPSGERERIGRYELLFEIASGGMGRVFLARQVGDAGFERLVALKRVHPHLVSDPEVYAMASDEARLTAMIHHPNVVPVIDVIDARGELVLVMDYVEGASVASLLKASGPLPVSVAARIAVDSLRGLSAAHEATDLVGGRVDIVHRDVSPQNLLVGVDGATRLVDFGIARAEGRLALTKSGVVKGKVVYMAPERLDQGDVDARSDLYGVAAVLFELVTGSIAFGSGDESAQMARVLLGGLDLGPLEKRCPSLVPVVEKALARSPSDRYESASAFADAIVAAVRPAEQSEVAAALRQARGTDLTERRRRVALAIAARAEEAEASGPSELPSFSAASAISASVSEREPPSKAARAPEVARPPRSARLALFGVLVLLVNAGGYGLVVAATRNGVVAPSPASSMVSTPAASASPREPSPAAPTATGATPFVAPSAIESSAGSPSTSAPSLHSPDLRRSPYKRP